MRYRIRETDLENGVCGAVVIARDEEDVLEGSLESLRLQTTRTFLMVVDDGSKDKTGEIASKYADVIVGLPNHARAGLLCNTLVKFEKTNHNCNRNIDNGKKQDERA